MPNALHLLRYFVAAWLLFCGLYGLVSSKHLVHSLRVWSWRSCSRWWSRLTRSPAQCLVMSLEQFEVDE